MVLNGVLKCCWETGEVVHRHHPPCSLAFALAALQSRKTLDFGRAQALMLIIYVRKSADRVRSTPLHSSRTCVWIVLSSSLRVHQHNVPVADRIQKRNAKVFLQSQQLRTTIECESPMEDAATCEVNELDSTNERTVLPLSCVHIDITPKR